MPPNERFLNEQNVRPIEIYRDIKNVYEDNAINVNNNNKTKNGMEGHQWVPKVLIQFHKMKWMRVALKFLTPI